MNRRRLFAALGVLTVFAGGGLLFGRAAAEAHVRKVTGRAVAESVACQNCHMPGEEVTYDRGTAHPDPWHMAATADGRTLFVACEGTGELAVIDVPGRELRGTVPLPGIVRGLAISPDGSILAAALHDRDQVALVDVVTLHVRGRIATGAGPSGVAYGAGGLLFTANSGSQDVSVLDLGVGGGVGPDDDPREIRRISAGREPFAATASPDGRAVAVVSRMVTNGPADRVPFAEVTILDGREGTVLRRVPLPSCHLSEGACFTADGSRVLVPAVHVRNLLPILQVARGWVMSTVLASIEVETGLVARLPLFDANTPCADPAGAAVSPDGERVFVAAGGNDRVHALHLPTALGFEDVCRPDQLEKLHLTRAYLLDRLRVGDNPRGLAVVGSGKDALLAVAARLDDRVEFYTLDGAPVARFDLGDHIDEDRVRMGDRVFHDASYAFQAAFSCRSCHPGAHTDGLTYDFDIDGVGRNPVLNRSLRGVKGTGPFKWIGLNPSIERQCGARFAMVLTRADVFPEEELGALADYLRSLPPPRPDLDAGRVGGRSTGAVGRGGVLFERTRRKDGTEIPPADRCVTCHPPPHYSNFLLADVGTKGPLDDHSEFDVPHLTGIGSKAPYLHDGRATTLESIWTAPGVDDHHGVMTDLNKSDLNDLVEFLKGL